MSNSSDLMESMEINPEEYLMHLQSERIKTFKNWPFNSSCKCTPEKMAKAGFFHCPTDQEPDAAMCFMCLKELDGWEPDDDPWEEHKNHSPQCPYLNQDGPLESLTVEQFLNIELARQKIKLKKAMETKIKEFEAAAKDVREEMEYLAQTNSR